MTFVDWFAGIGGVRRALERAGARCVWSCENDADARAVYGARFGGTEAGDVNDVRAADLPPADLWCAGFPCQDLSQAGKRQGFGGERSVLVFRLLDLAADLHPPWLLLENVAGLLSVRGGRDFGRLLARLDDLGYVGAWRVLDARFFGVPQRRRRVFLLARRAGADGPDPAQVLFESARVCGDSPARGAAGEDVAGPLGSRSPRGGWNDDFDRAGAFVTARPQNAHGQRFDGESETFIAAPLTAGGHPASNAPGRHREDDQNLVAAPITASAGHHGRSSGRGDGTENLVADPVSASEGKTYSHEGSHNFRLHNVVAVRTARVRRLTPLECERLQGFPDGWTALPGLADGTRYRLVGNSVAVPVVEWIARRWVQAVAQEEAA